MGCVAVFGVFNEDLGTEDIVVAAETRLTSKKGKRELAKQIKKAVFETIGYKPEQVVLIPPHSLFKTSSGKIQHFACKEAYLRGTLGKEKWGNLWRRLKLYFRILFLSLRK